MEQGEYYLINHLVLVTGLTDRTIRKYISAGLLEGEKINGLWHFTPEQVERFVCHPAVRPSIVAKNNGLIYDFLLDGKKTEKEACVVLDIPGADRRTIAEYFCYEISNGGYDNIHFSFDGATQVPRIFLRGEASQVLKLVNGYMEMK